jgi:hypothetical protein
MFNSDGRGPLKISFKPNQIKITTKKMIKVNLKCNRYHDNRSEFKPKAKLVLKNEAEIDKSGSNKRNYYSSMV